MYTCETRKSPPRKFPACGASDDTASEPSNNTVALLLTLAGAVAVPKGHPSAPDTVDITIQLPGFSNHTNAMNAPSPCSAGTGSASVSSAASQKTIMSDFADDKNAVWPLQEACTLRKPIYIADLGDRAQGFDKRGWNDEPRSAV